MPDGLGLLEVISTGIKNQYVGRNKSFSHGDTFINWLKILH